MVSKKTRQDISPSSFNHILFAFAKEFGWGYDYVRNMPYKLFRIYSNELIRHYKEQEAASKGKKSKQKSSPLTDEEKENRRKMIMEMSNHGGHR